MKKEYILIEGEKYKVLMSFEEIDFDYYTDVCIELIFDKKPIILFKDNLSALRNIINQCNENTNRLDVDLDENKLGILLNNYYRGIYENQFQDSLVLDNQGRWIGEKYCCFFGSEYVTWIYRYDEDIIMKVTPVFGGFEEAGYVQEYYKFVQEYKDVFREIISLPELINMKKIIFELYNELLL